MSLSRRGGLSIVFGLAVGVFLVGALGGRGGQPGPKRLPVPKQEALDRANKLIGELFRDDLIKALDSKAPNNREVRLALAQRFLLEARDTTDDPAGKYVLLRDAATHASMAGDGATALLALEELAVSFDIPAKEILDQKIQALQTAAKSPATPDAYQGIVEAALALMEEAIAVDEFDNAVKLGATADNAAKKLKNVPLVSSIRKRNEEVKALQAEYAQVKPFVETLQKNPKDAKANLEAGRYYALVKGNWEKGLPLLALGGDAGLKETATLDLASPQDSFKQAVLGDRWAAQAGQLKGSGRVNALLRAYHWYQYALAQAGDKERVKLQTSMAAVNDQLPAEFRIGELASEWRRFTGHSGPVFGASISADGAKVASAGADGTVRLWDGRSGKELRRFDGHNGPAWTVALSPDGRRVVSGGFDGAIRAWDPVSGRESKRFPNGHGDYVRSVVFSGNGQFILSGGDDRLVKLWDADTGTELKTCAGHDHFVFGVAITRDGKRGLSASLDRTVRYWDLGSGTALKVLSGHTDTVLGVAFTPDGRRALSASTDKTLRLWDLNTGETVHVFKGHKGYVQGVAVSPDGRRALSVGADGKVILWDVDTGKLLRELEGHTGPVWAVSYAANGRFAVTAGNDGTVRLWGSAK
jgi:hypothetical protein